MRKLIEQIQFASVELEVSQGHLGCLGKEGGSHPTATKDQQLLLVPRAHVAVEGDTPVNCKLIFFVESFFT